MTGDAKCITKVEPSEENMLFEGDIVIPKNGLEFGKTLRGGSVGQLNMEPSSRRNIITKYRSHRWTFPIKYHINRNVREYAIREGIKTWEQETCARFTEQDKPIVGNGLEFVEKDGCWSYVGKQGTTSQEISASCGALTSMNHEIGHALGLHHEHKHFKRDAHVVVLSDNINPGYLYAFNMVQESKVEDFGIAYDHGSVMHYGRFDFSKYSKYKKYSIRTKDRDYQYTIGQVVPSFADVKKINFAYCNSTCPNTLNCKRGGYVNPNNCNRCKCPVGFGGQLCEKVAANIKTCGPNDLTATRKTQTIRAAGAKTCYYLIKAPTNKRVYFELTKNFREQGACYSEYVEINYIGDFTVTGARYCVYSPRVSQSQREELLVIYKGTANSHFALSYHYGDPSPQKSGVNMSTEELITTFFGG